MKVELLAVTKPENGLSLKELIEFAGRVCTNTKERVGENTDNFLNNRIAQGHLSIFEHINFTFLVSNVSRSFSHQLVRHRIASYSQQSMRYVNQSGYWCDYITPPALFNNEEALQVYDRFMNIAWETYDDLISRGIKKEDARFVLPIASPTEIMITMNLRQWWHTIKMREAKDAQWEIREFAREVKGIIDRLLNLR